MSAQKRKIDVPKYIDDKSFVTLKEMGNIREVSITNSKNSGATILPLSKDKYVLLSTGEVKNFENHATNRVENIRNLEKSMKALQDLINSNITPENIRKCRFITLTYKENTRNPDLLYQDFKNFNKRFKRYIEKAENSYEYIVTVEAQGRGAFHLHCIYIFEETPPFIENSTLAEIWGKGYVSIKSLIGDIDNIGKYLTAYLSDLPVDDTGFDIDIIKGKVKEADTKRYIKNARLILLPQGIRIYRYSKGIKKPVKTTTTYGEALTSLERDGYTKTNEYAVEIVDDMRNFKTKYIKQTYKKYKRKPIKKRDDKNE